MTALPDGHQNVFSKLQWFNVMPGSVQFTLSCAYQCPPCHSLAGLLHTALCVAQRAGARGMVRARASAALAQLASGRASRLAPPAAGWGRSRRASPSAARTCTPPAARAAGSGHAHRSAPDDRAHPAGCRPGSHPRRRTRSSRSKIPSRRPWLSMGGEARRDARRTRTRASRRARRTRESAARRSARCGRKRTRSSK